MKMRSDTLSRHSKTHNPTTPCKFCNEHIRVDKLLKHETLCKDKIDPRFCDRTTSVIGDGRLTCEAVNGTFRSYELNILKHKDYELIMTEVTRAAKHLIVKLLEQGPIKAQIIVTLTFEKRNNEGYITSEKVFRSICEPLVLGDDLEKYVSRVKYYIMQRIQEYERHGSGWVFKEYNCSNVDVADFHPLRASGTSWVPKKLRDMKSILDIPSPDGRCFLYCILSKLFPVSNNAYRYTKYLEHVDEIDMCGIKFPMKLTDIPKIEEKNNLSISVFEWNTLDNCIDPLKHGSGQGTQIDLLYIENEDNAHFLSIKNFNTFMQHRTNHKATMFYCRKCLHGFATEDNYEAHIGRCKQGIYQNVVMPDKGSIKFEGEIKQIPKVFMMYCDFESILKRMQTCRNDPTKSSTERFQKHEACSFSIVTKCRIEGFEEETIAFTHEDPDIVTQTFIKELIRIREKMMIFLKKSQYPIHMTKKSKLEFVNATICHICEKKLNWNSEHNYPVRDHDHTKEYDNYRGAAHNFCNINYWDRIARKVPVIFHNLKSYDINIFLLDLIKQYKKLTVIPENLEKFKSIITNDFVFLDSLQFLSSSLEDLVNNLKTSDSDALKRLKSEFPEHHGILSHKGIYFYEYITSYSMFSETTLPPKEAFYSNLTQEGIDDDAYESAKAVYYKTNCQNLLDYMLLYVKLDSILLCDVFENFRDLCLEYYKLDPAHYFSLPGFGWDAMLKMTGVEIEYMTDMDMYNFIENNIRGGICTISHKYFKANNKYIDGYDNTKPSSFITYQDANNLYACGLASKLPIKDYRWLTEADVADFQVQDVDVGGDTCYILEVDLHYPQHLHDDHNCYPLAVEKKRITKDDLSPYNKDFLLKNKERYISNSKLCPDLRDKYNYVCSLKNLQFYINHGLVLTKIHRILAAYQTNFMEPFISFTSKKRAEAVSKFQQTLFKFIINANYGKCIEDIRKRSNVEVVTDEKRAKKLIARPQYKGYQILDKQVALVHSMKGKIKLSKPIACGFIVLEESKHLMMWYWYDVLKQKYKDNIKLILSDTDSLLFIVYTEDIYKDMIDKSFKQHLDLSNYEESSKLYDRTNRKVIGKFKDETEGVPIREAIVLKPKMYSLLLNDGQNPKRAKSVPRAAKSKLTHEDYRAVLEKATTKQIQASSIRSFKHVLFTIKVSKKGLSAFDDKKYVMQDGVNCLSYGHYKIKTLGQY